MKLPLVNKSKMTSDELYKLIKDLKRALKIAKNEYLENPSQLQLWYTRNTKNDLDYAIQRYHVLQIKISKIHRANMFYNRYSTSAINILNKVRNSGNSILSKISMSHNKLIN